MERKSRRSCPLPSPQSVMHYLRFNFLVTVFVFGPGTAQQILLVLTQGVFASPPFTCIRKKNDGLKNVLRKKKMYFFINKVFKTTLVASHHSGARPFPTAVVGGRQGTAGLRLEPQSKEGSPHPMPRVLWFWDGDSYPEGPPTQARGAPAPTFWQEPQEQTCKSRLGPHHSSQAAAEPSSTQVARSLGTAWLIRHEQ